MRLAKVVGNVVSTIKDEGYHGYQLMLVEYFDPISGKSLPPRQMAFNMADAGVGDIVLVNIDGGAGNMICHDDFAIVDLVICGIVDNYTAYGETKVIHGKTED